MVKVFPGEVDGLEVAESLDDRRQEGSHGDDEDADGTASGIRGTGQPGIGGAGGPAVLGMGQAAQDRQAGGDGVRARGEPLVGQRLPGGEDGDVGCGQVAGQGGGGLLRLPAGGGHDEQGRAVVGTRGVGLRAAGTFGGKRAGGGSRTDGAGDSRGAQCHGGQDGGARARRDDDGAVGAGAAAGCGNEVVDRRVGEKRGQEGGQTHGEQSRGAAPEGERAAGRCGSSRSDVRRMIGMRNRGPGASMAPGSR